MNFDKAAFFRSIRASIAAPRLSRDAVSGCETILAAMAGTSPAHCAYALATAWHETARTMQPVREACWLSEDWRRNHLRYYPWYGRGYIQLTWEANYRRADDELGLDGALLANPDLALARAIAAPVLRRGMSEGWFTGQTLARHLPEPRGSVRQFEAARRIVNGTDRAGVIAAHAMHFQQALLDGGWQ